MKKLSLLVTALFVTILSYSQIIVNQSVSAGPYKVGDTVTVTYSVDKGTTTPRYFWLRYQYNNKALTYVSTTFSQGSQSQTYYECLFHYELHVVDILDGCPQSIDIHCLIAVDQWCFYNEQYHLVSFECKEVLECAFNICS